jgi:hypothetical protein
MRRFVERRARQLVAAAADAALDAGLAGLIAAWRQAEMRADVRERRKRLGWSVGARNASAVRGPDPTP